MRAKYHLKCPTLAILHFTTRGTSADTKYYCRRQYSDFGEKFQIPLPKGELNWLPHLHGYSFLQTLLVYDNLLFPFPSSPLAENFILPFAQVITTVSAKWLKYQHIGANSLEGLLHIAGLHNFGCQVVQVINFIPLSETFSRFSASDLSSKVLLFSP